MDINNISISRYLFLGSVVIFFLILAPISLMYLMGFNILIFFPVLCAGIFILFFLLNLMKSLNKDDAFDITFKEDKSSDEVHFNHHCVSISQLNSKNQNTSESDKLYSLNSKNSDFYEYKKL